MMDKIDKREAVEREYFRELREAQIKSGKIFVRTFADGSEIVSLFSKPDPRLKDL